MAYALRDWQYPHDAELYTESQMLASATYNFTPNAFEKYGLYNCFEHSVRIRFETPTVETSDIE